ncbi:hypothetical protein GCM10023323_47590 [Streptomyces thinghirensis]|uniref:Uncharacterized protein n=1 Tax=Streptomyces thinghirensis TaxID=551547 RepID=A0ABP9TA04_9ACTN
MAISAATPARATAAARRWVVRDAVWEVRLWGVLLLNTDSFCVAAGRAARGDRPAGGPAGQYWFGTQKPRARS